MKKFVFIICALFAGITAGKAQMSADYSRSIETLQKMADNANEARYEYDYDSAADYVRQAIVVFNTQPRDFQQANQALKSELYYDLARYLSLKGDVDGAVDAFAEAIDYGWNNWDFARNDPDLDKIRRNKKFKSIMLAIKE